MPLPMELTTPPVTKMYFVLDTRTASLMGRCGSIPDGASGNHTRTLFFMETPTDTPRTAGTRLLCQNRLRKQV
jgi:hypothetical protein